MRTTKSKFMTAAGFALVALMSTLSFSGATSAAEGIRKHNGVSVNIGNGGTNRGNNWRHRNFSENSGYDNNNYRRHHRRHRGIGFGGITIDLGSIDSDCRYSYRKWQNTGSRYWRRQYYNCIG